MLGALDALTRDGLGADLSPVAAHVGRGGERSRRSSEAILRIAAKSDRNAVRKMLKDVPLGNDTRSLLLALCKIGNVDDCAFILRLIGSADQEVQLYNHVRIASAMASICRPSLRKRLRKYLRSPEFWNYIPRDSKRSLNQLPLERLENQALLKRLIGACFVEVAGPKDIGLLKKLLSHDYEWLATLAAEKLSKLGRDADIFRLNEKLLQMTDLELESEAMPMVQAVCMLDRKVHSGGRPLTAQANVIKRAVT